MAPPCRASPMARRWTLFWPSSTKPTHCAFPTCRSDWVKLVSTPVERGFIDFVLAQ
ncbi:hypothetical protein [Malikia sp.]|uniref:hypothetical protein n=1 Tax=Malikia sp. TaxID=2070706 RepID=UPI0026238A1F|nr:hypothetical protein [Malikia sp.]MDD2728261.1 hypothetical protein [Malikia sp.]